MATKWLLDPTHSEITFKVKHLMISNVKGEFTTLTQKSMQKTIHLRTQKFQLSLIQILFSLIMQTEIRI